MDKSGRENPEQQDTPENLDVSLMCCWGEKAPFVATGSCRKQPGRKEVKLKKTRKQDCSCSTMKKKVSRGRSPNFTSSVYSTKGSSFSISNSSKDSSSKIWLGVDAMKNVDPYEFVFYSLMKGLEQAIVLVAQASHTVIHYRRNHIYSALLKDSRKKSKTLMESLLKTRKNNLFKEKSAKEMGLSVRL